MNTAAYRELKLLTEISSGGSVTQRGLAKKHGLALGLTNFLMRRMVKKGYVKIMNLERKRLRYLITPKGVAEKARLTCEYLEYSLYLYRNVRTFLSHVLSVVVESGRKDAVLYGTGEVAEIAFLIMHQHGINVLSVVDEPPGDHALFMNQSVNGLEQLQERAFDWVVVAALKNQRAIVQRLRDAGVPQEKIIAIPDEERVEGMPQLAMETLRDTPASMVGEGLRS